jgi:hypothetical protein
MPSCGIPCPNVNFKLQNNISVGQHYNIVFQSATLIPGEELPIATHINYILLALETQSELWRPPPQLLYSNACRVGKCLWIINCRTHAVNCDRLSIALGAVPRKSLSTNIVHKAVGQPKSFLLLVTTNTSPCALQRNLYILSSTVKASKWANLPANGLEMVMNPINLRKLFAVPISSGTFSLFKMTRRS